MKRVHGDLLDGYQPETQKEAGHVARMRTITGDPWRRDTPLHFTASALVVHPPTGRVLLRWHERQGAWLQVGGHADPGESDPLLIALREAREETGLPDLRPWPDASLRQAVIVSVTPSSEKGEPAHEHADLRYLLATDVPDEITPENPAAVLRWLSIADARDLAGSGNLSEFLDRIEGLLC
jgi:8-oxo-dGTP pyrophosphatase MutT (NUDIX family)